MSVSPLMSTALVAGMTLFQSLWAEDNPPDNPQVLVNHTWDDLQSGQRFLFHGDGVMEFHRWDATRAAWIDQGANTFTLSPSRVQVGASTDCHFAWTTPEYIFDITGENCGKHGSWTGTYTRSEYRIGEDGRMIAPWWDAE